MAEYDHAPGFRAETPPVSVHSFRILACDLFGHRGRGKILSQIHPLQQGTVKRPEMDPAPLDLLIIYGIDQ